MTTRTPTTAAAAPLAPGDRAYLVPKTIGPPRESWSHPAVTVVAVVPTKGITVRLADGQEITTARANVVRRRPPDPPPTRAPRPATSTPNQVELW